MGDARLRVENAFIERIGTADVIAMPEIAAEVAAMVAGEPDWKRDLQDEMFMQMVYTIGQRLVPQARRQLIEARRAVERQQRRQRGLVQLRFSKPEARVRILWDTVFEVVGGGKQIRLRSMTRDDLLTAAALRATRADRESTWSEFFTVLATKVPIGKMVEDVVTVDQMDDLYSACEQGIRRAQ